MHPDLPPCAVAEALGEGGRQLEDVALALAFELGVEFGDERLGPHLDEQVLRRELVDGLVVAVGGEVDRREVFLLERTFRRLQRRKPDTQSLDLFVGRGVGHFDLRLLAWQARVLHQLGRWTRLDRRLEGEVFALFEPLNLSDLRRRYDVQLTFPHGFGEQV